MSQGPIRVGSIYDLHGPLNLIGTPKDDAARLAIKDINAHGGLLGRQVELYSYDARSDNDKYVQYAKRLIQADRVVVMDAGVTSASREAIRPIVDRAKTPLFYSELYEGGVCDKNVFNTGSVPSQQLAQLISYAMRHFGQRFYVVAADYNFGHFEAAWAKKYIERSGGLLVSTDFLPLNQSDFGATLNELRAAKPDVLVSLLVGGKQMAFYRQFAAAALTQHVHIVTPVFGDGQEQLQVGTRATNGIVIAYWYLQELNTTENRRFVSYWFKEYGPGYPYITPDAVAVWNSWHLWAAAVRKAGTLERNRVTAALESGISFNGPGGKVTLDAGSHHAIQDVHVARGTSTGAFQVLKTYKQVRPAFEQSKCNLVKNPTINTQFTPSP